jgi:hypothetical protein
MGQLKPALRPMMSYCSVIREVEDTEVLTSYTGVLESVQLKEVYLAFNPQFHHLRPPLAARGRERLARWKARRAKRSRRATSWSLA